MKIQFKIALLFTLLCTAVIIALSAAIYYFANANAFQDFFTRLELRANIAARANFNVEAKTAAAFEKIRTEHLKKLPEEKEYIINADSINNMVGMDLTNELPSTFFNDIRLKKSASFRKDYHFYSGIYYPTSRGNYLIIISAQNVYARQFLSNLRTVLIIGCMVSMVLVFSIGLLFSRQILLPIRNMTREVKKLKRPTCTSGCLLNPARMRCRNLRKPLIT